MNGTISFDGNEKTRSVHKDMDGKYNASQMINCISEDDMNEKKSKDVPNSFSARSEIVFLPI